MAYIEGFDISGWQIDQINKRCLRWQDVRYDVRDLRFVFIKASEGIGYASPYYEQGAVDASSIGLAQAPYHFYRDAVDPVAQARHFYNVAGGSGSNLPPSLDLEDTGALRKGNDLESRVRACLEEIEVLWERKPIIYTADWYIRPRMPNHKLGTYPLWVANYQKKPIKPYLPIGWTEWLFWQWTSTGRLMGATGNIDLNYFNGDANALYQMTGGRPLSIEEKVRILWQNHPATG